MWARSGGHTFATKRGPSRPVAGNEKNGIPPTDKAGEIPNGEHLQVFGSTLSRYQQHASLRDGGQDAARLDRVTRVRPKAPEAGKVARRLVGGCQAPRARFDAGDLAAMLVGVGS